ncbi:hypothetical protein Y032_0013g2172 [Ancylostoma ceylanicum]|uniref:Uncharacterized protein n=1 Tax=Ancylostoma ceylanicum TaxID=53326 RepID=A0A016VBV3_9BILA|nr:hypothetical protein Y032_0013g2172 [Ancylostoma ceylanicum]
MAEETDVNNSGSVVLLNFMTEEELVVNFLDNVATLELKVISADCDSFEPTIAAEPKVVFLGDVSPFGSIVERELDVIFPTSRVSLDFTIAELEVNLKDVASLDSEGAAELGVSDVASLDSEVAAELGVSDVASLDSEGAAELGVSDVASLDSDVTIELGVVPQTGVVPLDFGENELEILSVGRRSVLDGSF